MRSHTKMKKRKKIGQRNSDTTMDPWIKPEMIARFTEKLLSSLCEIICICFYIAFLYWFKGCIFGYMSDGHRVKQQERIVRTARNRYNRNFLYTRGGRKKSPTEKKSNGKKVQRKKGPTEKKSNGKKVQRKKIPKFGNL